MATAAQGIYSLDTYTCRRLIPWTMEPDSFLESGCRMSTKAGVQEQEKFRPNN